MRLPIWKSVAIRTERWRWFNVLYDVCIEGDVTDLSPLECLTTVGRNLTIVAPDLTSLSGLENLASRGIDGLGPPSGLQERFPGSFRASPPKPSLHASVEAPFAAPV